MHHARILLVAAAAALAAVATTQSASAHAAPFTVTAGSAPAGTAVAVTLRSNAFDFRDTSTGITVNCPATTVRGSVTTGSRPARIGTLQGTSFTLRCPGPIGLYFAITGYGTWTLDAGDSTASVTKITVSNVRAHVGPFGSGRMCSWDFAASSGSFTSSGTATTSPGSVATSYTNSSQVLALPATNPGSLGLWNVTGERGATQTYCIAPSIFKQGDRIAWAMSWTVTADNPAYRPVSIT